MKDPKDRFSDRTDDYKKYHPDYPEEALAFIKKLCRREKRLEIADNGPGTGIFSRALCDVFGCTVYGVEPKIFFIVLYPSSGSAKYEYSKVKLEKLFYKTNDNGMGVFEYVVQIYLGQMV